jgi:hypothetical protein
MDISRYIGLYLVKNGYCSLPSLGTLQLDKVGAKRYDSTSVEPPVYKITFNPVGSIDDKFPHFIAMNENISTNNATNAISTFGKEVKEEIANNRPFVIDGLGRFLNANGKVDFQQLSDLNLSEFSMAMPEPPPTISDRPQQTDKDGTNNVDFKTTLNNPIKESNFNIGKVLMPIGLLALIAVGGYFGYNYLKNQKEVAPAEKPVIKDTVTVAPIAVDTTKLDSTTTLAPTATNVPVDTTKPAPVAAPTASGPAVKVAILTYKTEAEANAKAKKLATNINNITSVIKQDSATYKVVLSVPADKAPNLIADSLRKFFNPGEKYGKVEVIK